MGAHKSKLSPKQLKEILNSTVFTESEIRIWYKSFLKECPSGMLTLEEFKKCASDVFASGDSMDYTERLFKSFDTNQNGTIDFREFMCALSVTSFGTFDEKLRWAFRMFDTDNDGSITRDEVKLMVQAIYNLIDDESKMEMFPDSLTVTERVNKIFAIMDKDGDNYITAEEFTLATKKDPSLILILRLGENAKRDSFSF